MVLQHFSILVNVKLYYVQNNKSFFSFKEIDTVLLFSNDDLSHF